MTKFIDTAEGQDFIASGHSRETSPEVLEAIAFFARDLEEAEAAWNGDGRVRGICTDRDIWEHATSNGTRDADLHWGQEGEFWAEEFEANRA